MVKANHALSNSLVEIVTVFLEQDKRQKNLEVSQFVSAFGTTNIFCI